MIKQKDLNDYLNEDPSLTEKITYEQFINRQIKAENKKTIGTNNLAYKFSKDDECIVNGKNTR
ncbi:MAG: hypothetical protein NC417_07070 [Candidatus Gastranaerophilales bacterium]|nr:hypothetical protein [Candidatus Gastranaerophilales bacterium]